MSIPVRLVHESRGQTVTVELDNGETYEGTLTGADNQLNVELSKVKVTDKKGRTRDVERILLRGSTITFFGLPPTLPIAPIVAEAENAAATATPADAKKRAR
jgi:small nuclear ribonucleoprotein (snRNP)-like protein